MTLTAVAEVDVVDVTWQGGDVIEARDRDVTSAEEAGGLAQCSLEPASAAVARQGIARHRPETIQDKSQSSSLQIDLEQWCSVFFVPWTPLTLPCPPPCPSIKC